MIDEWQEAPLIWDAVRGKVDKDPTKGQYILTGSSSINKNSYIHSETGRIAHLKMRTMSLYGSNNSNGKISLHDICLNNAKDVYTGNVKLDDLINFVLTGGWPASIDLTIEQSILIAREYVKSIIDEDIYKIDNIKRDKHKIGLLLKSLARNESTTATNAILK